MIRTCTHCGSKNRVPAHNLADTGRCGSCKKPLAPVSSPIDVDDVLFNQITSEARVPVLVDFWAEWCGPCKMAAPAVAKAAESLAGKALVLKVDTERAPALAAKFNVRSIPNFALFRDGKLRWQQPGVLSQQQLEQVALGME